MLNERSTAKMLLVVVILSSWSLQCFVSAGDVFASSAHLRLLADGEQRLVDALINYLATERRRLLQLDQLDTISISYYQQQLRISGALLNILHVTE